MLKGITKTGFQFRIDGDKLDDWEFLKILNDADKNGLRAVDAMEFALGEKHLEELVEHCKKRNKNGKVKVATMMEEFKDIMEKAGEAKNS